MARIALTENQLRRIVMKEFFDALRKENVNTANIVDVTNTRCEKKENQKYEFKIDVEIKR